MNVEHSLAWLLRFDTAPSFNRTHCTALSPTTQPYPAHPRRNLASSIAFAMPAFTILPGAEEEKGKALVSVLGAQCSGGIPSEERRGRHFRTRLSGVGRSAQ